MKRYMLLGLVLSVSLIAWDCNDNGGNNYPTPRPTSTAVVPTPSPTPVPDLDPPLPKYIGFTQVGDTTAPPDWPSGVKFMNNEQFANESLANGFQAVHLWGHASHLSQDIKQVICNPGIKAIAIRPGSRIGRDTDVDPENKHENAAVWENADYGQMAYDLLERYGDLACRGGEPLTIILNNWEGDWQAKGAFRRLAVPTPRRLHRIEAEFEMAQWGMNWARSQFPDAQLRIYFGLVVNHRLDDKYEWTVVRDLIPKLDPQPDLIGHSFYGDQGDETPTQMVETTTRHTGYPVSRQYVAETGVNEKWPGKQLQDMEPRLEEMEAVGLRLIFVWTWKQYWPGELDEEGNRTNGWFGNWVVDENAPGGVHNNVLNCWTSGMEFIQEFRQTFDENPLPPVEKPDCSAEPTPTPVPPTATPKPPTPTRTPTVVTDPCAHCPAPNSVGCSINWTMCVQCWENCGQPIEPTKTPTPFVPPTKTPTKTPTPDPSNPCPQCPDPNGFSCQMWPDMCYQCWADCGHPLATPTPTRTPTATRTPTPKPLEDNPLLRINFEGYPDHCTVVTRHQESGSTKTYLIPDCNQINLSFDKTGLWHIELTAEYLHGWQVNDVHEVAPTPEEAADPLFIGKMNGDLDGDGKYEFRYIRGINILSRPEVAGPVA